MALLAFHIASFLSAAALLAAYFAAVLMLILYGARWAAPVVRWLDRVPRKTDRGAAPARRQSPVIG